jgi:hypothetical protein
MKAEEHKDEEKEMEKRMLKQRKGEEFYIGLSNDDSTSSRFIASNYWTIVNNELEKI